MSATVHVCESSGIWAARLRRELATDAAMVREVRSREQLDAALGEEFGADAFVVLELTPRNAEEVCNWMLRATRQRPACRVAVVSARETAIEWRDTAREWGALAVLTFAWEAAFLARLVRRHAAIYAAASDKDAFPAWIRNKLPWG